MIRKIPSVSQYVDEDYNRLWTTEVLAGPLSKGRLAHCIDCLPLNQNLKLLGCSIILPITKFL